MRAEAADGAFLDGDQHFVLARRGGRIRSRVERLGEARVGDRGRQAARRRAPRPPSAHSARRVPKRQERDRACLRARCGPCRSRAARRARAARRRRRRRADSGRRSGRSSMRGRGRDHVDELGLVGRRHHHEAGQAGEIGDVEGAGMGRRRRRRRGRRGRWRSAPAGSGSRRRARPGRRRAAGRSNRWRRTACSPSVARPAAKVTACCSAMPTSKVRVGKAFGEQVEAGAGRHGGGDGDDLVVALAPRRSGCRRRPWYRRARWRLALGLRAGDDVELGDAVIFVGGGLGRRVALALLGHDMDQDRAARACRARSCSTGSRWSRLWPSIGPT